MFVGLGPSSNTCPRCQPQFLQLTSIRFIPKLLSSRYSILSSLIGSKKLGHPVPESNFVSEEKSSVPQHEHLYNPLSFASQ